MYVISFKGLGFSVGSSFSLDSTQRQVRSSIFCAKISTSMRWSTSIRTVQNAAQFVFSPPLGNSLNNIEKMESLSLVDTRSAPRDSPRQVFVFWQCHPLLLAMGGPMIPNIRSLTRYSERHSWGREFGYFYSNQPV